MRYRVYKESSKFVYEPDFPYEIRGNLPTLKKVFTKDFEWKYTFTDIWNDIKTLCIYYLYRFTMKKIFPILGLTLREHYTCVDTSNYIEVDFDNIRDLIMSKLDDYQKLRLYKQKVMVIIGKDIIKEFHKVNTPYSFFIYPEYKFSSRGLNGYTEVAKVSAQVPVYFLPELEGILIIPDLTDSHLHLKNINGSSYKTEYEPFTDVYRKQKIKDDKGWITDSEHYGRYHL